MNVQEAVKKSDLVIGSVLIPGARAPKLVTEETVSEMEAGSVIVDVAIDQGGNFETSDQLLHMIIQHLQSMVYYTIPLPICQELYREHRRLG